MFTPSGVTSLTTSPTACDMSRIFEMSSRRSVKFTLPSKAAETLEPVYWNYGAFIQQCIDFTILALCVFLMVKLMNRLMKKKEEAPQPAPEPAPTKEELLLAEIRDLLKEKK